MAREEVPYTLEKVKDDEHWHQIRNTGLGGSDAAAAAGLSPWKSTMTLWMEKTGAVQPADLSEQKNVRWGTILEPVLADEYAKRNPQVKVRRNRAVLRSKAHPFMLANLDRVVLDPVRGRGGLEIKTTGFFAGDGWGEDGCDGAEGVPVHYQIQVQHYLAVTGFDFFDVAVLIAGQDDRYYTITRDQDLIDALILAEERLWGMIQTNMMPDLTGHPDEGGALLSMFPGGQEAVLELSTEDAVRFTDQYLTGAAAEKAGKAQKDAAKSNLKALMGDHSKGKVGDVSVSWSRFDKSKTDWDTVRELAAEIVAANTIKVPSDRFTVTPPKASKKN
jgi:putative phage-type endonuclease